VASTPDELGVIRSIVGRAKKLPKGYFRIGDDVAVVPTGAGSLVFKVDMLVEHTDMPAGMTYRQAARKAVAMCVSDFAAKGARPDSFVVSLGLKKGVSQEQVDALASGFRDAEEEWDVLLVGGDTNEAKELVIDCAMVGFAKHLVSRRGAKPGDALIVTGLFGYPPAGLRILNGTAVAKGEFGEKARASVLDPTPSLEVGRALGRFLSSSMDSSDGLARSLHTLATESGVGFEVTALPAAAGVLEFAEANGLSMRELVLEGGEEYLIAGTIPRSRIAGARAAAQKAGGALLEIGKATPEAGQVVLVTGRTKRHIRDVGWTHLS
jgi:thiamine-monophosphate kinase